MSNTGRASSPPPYPWWLMGRERCETCLQVYVLEMEARCEYCDGPLCPMCIVELQESSLRVCPDCAPTESES